MKCNKKKNSKCGHISKEMNCEKENNLNRLRLIYEPMEWSRNSHKLEFASSNRLMKQNFLKMEYRMKRIYQFDV